MMKAEEFLFFFWVVSRGKMVWSGLVRLEASLVWNFGKATRGREVGRKTSRLEAVLIQLESTV